MKTDLLNRIAAMRSLWYLAALLLAVFTYFYGLDGLHIPRNGDEDVYTHITRLTAQNGQWLPLRSELNDMRNTKPPLLFWQGIASTHSGSQWDRWHLRYPSVLYTLLTTLMVFLLGNKLTGKLETGVVAALTYLAFFSTYRYGRPFLINPAEVFWLFLPFFTLLYGRPFSFESRLWIPLLMGVEVGIGLLYKSFALLAPVGLALAWWYLHQRRYRWREFVLKDAAKPILTGAVALSLFALWFVFDPDPQSVWREFVLGENAGKFDAHGDGYWTQLMWGGSSVWALLLGYPMNAGLLAFPVIALFVVTYRRRFQLSVDEKLLWIWIVVFFIVFAIPSQRSARYLLEAMPGVALLCALNWQRIPRWVFVVSLLVASLLLFLMGFLGLQLQKEIAGIYGWGEGVLWTLTLLFILLTLFKKEWTRGLVNVAVLLTLLGIAVFLRPFDGALGTFSENARFYVQDKEVWVPCNFRAQDEGYRFMLKGALVHGYDESWNLTSEQLVDRYPLFTQQLPLQVQPCSECKVIGQRLEIRGRHSNEELLAMLHGDVFQHLFVREWMLESPPRNGIRRPNEPAVGCR